MASIPASRSCPAALDVGAKPSTTIATRFRAFADGLEGRGFPGSGKSLKTVDAVGRVQDFLDDATLRVVQERIACWPVLAPAPRS